MLLGLRGLPFPVSSSSPNPGSGLPPRGGILHPVSKLRRSGLPASPQFHPPAFSSSLSLAQPPGWAHSAELDVVLCAPSWLSASAGSDPGLSLCAGLPRWSALWCGQ